MSLDCGRETTRTGEDMQPPHKEARIQIQDLLVCAPMCRPRRI
uniref:Uncharacterized protein n=1 Tax=Anguilla anguilla TaxID=7936 RepID=A0A0E9S211_ANGAN